VPLLNFALTWPFGEAWLYPIIVGAGLAASLSVAHRRLHLDGFSGQVSRRLLVAAFVSLLLGGQIAWLLRHFGEFESPSLALVPHAGHIVSWVGLALVAWITLALSRQIGRKARASLDALAPAGVVLWLVERLAAWASGQDEGIVASSLPWAMSYPQGSELWSEHVRDLGLSPDAQTSLALHPVQVYSALLAGMTLSFLWRNFAALKTKPGLASGLSLVALALDDLLFSRLHHSFDGRAFLMLSAREFFAVIGMGAGLWLVTSSRVATRATITKPVEPRADTPKIDHSQKSKPAANHRREKKNRKRR
jgi:phosphatidylglycerol:prolipoprotein diacylglycerol transferase